MSEISSFGLRLLAEEVVRHPRENVFVSPLSVYLALAMTEYGAGGETRAAMRRTLSIPDNVSDEELHQSVAGFTKQLAVAPRYRAGDRQCRMGESEHAALSGLCRALQAV